MRKTTIAALFLIVLVLLGGYYAYQKTETTEEKNDQDISAALNELDRTYMNYSAEARRLGQEYGISPSYLLALISLETSGFNPPRSRFEKGVYRRLQAVKRGDRKSYEQVKSKHLKALNDEGLRNLSTSWGPFQIMGYKCVAMGLNVHHLRGEAALETGMKWMDEEYGRMLRKKRYKDAFHIHNTGRKFPRSGRSATHDPTYIDRGLEYIDYFDQKFAAEG